MTNTTDPWATLNENALTLRLYFPQWQGAGVESIREFFSEVPLEEARRGYAVGAAVLNAVLPAHSGPTALVPVSSGDLGLGKQDGIEAKEAVVAQLAAHLKSLQASRDLSATREVQSVLRYRWFVSLERKTVPGRSRWGGRLVEQADHAQLFKSFGLVVQRARTYPGFFGTLGAVSPNNTMGRSRSYCSCSGQSVCC